METQNIFLIGPQATGKHFIGRESMLQRLQSVIDFGRSHQAISLVGLSRVGKSSLIANAFSEDIVHRRGGIYVSIVLTEHLNYILFLRAIINGLKDGLEQFFSEQKNDLLLARQFEKALLAQNDENGYLLLCLSIKGILQLLKRKNIGVLLVIDEFDGATHLFEKKKQYFEFIRTIASSAEYAVNTILVSRRNLEIIEECSPENSTFNGVFDRITLTGFDDTDLQKYFCILRDAGIQINSDIAKHLQYYAGRIPYLLSIFGYYLVNSEHHDLLPNSIDAIYRANKLMFEVYFDRLVKQLVHDSLYCSLLQIVRDRNSSGSEVTALAAMGFLEYNGLEAYSVCPYFTTKMLACAENEHQEGFAMEIKNERIMVLASYISENLILRVNYADAALHENEPGKKRTYEKRKEKIESAIVDYSVELNSILPDSMSLNEVLGTDLAIVMQLGIKHIADSDSKMLTAAFEEVCASYESKHIIGDAENEQIERYKAEAGASVTGKLELTIPIIPLLLNYKTDVSLNLNLKKVIRMFFSKIKK